MMARRSSYAKGERTAGVIRRDFPACWTEGLTAATCLDQRVGVGDGKLIRMCTYQDYLGRQYSRELNAAELCPTYYVALPHYGYL